MNNKHQSKKMFALKKKTKKHPITTHTGKPRLCENTMSCRLISISFLPL